MRHLWHCCLTMLVSCKVMSYFHYWSDLLISLFALYYDNKRSKSKCCFAFFLWVFSPMSTILECIYDTQRQLLSKILNEKY